MSGTELKQRLAAILAADGVGYSRLMAADERATVAALDAAREVFRRQIESRQGRVIDMAGDSVLAVFETATGAVSAALAIQQEINLSEEQKPEDRRMRFRIGVHLGDVIEKGDGTIYGDGVNIAARLEGLAEPGGITISLSIRTAVTGKVSARFEDQGAQLVKNIAEPVRAYRVAPDGGAAAKPAHAAGDANRSLRDKPSPAAPRLSTGRSARAVGITAVVIAALAGGGYWLYRGNEATRLEQDALAAQLAREKQATVDARRAAEEQARRAAEAESKAERDRLAAESAKREAILQAQAQATDEARRRNDTERKRLENERLRLETEQRSAAATREAKAPTAPAPRTAGPERAAAAVPSNPAAGTDVASAKAVAGGSNRFDGAYECRHCFFDDPGKQTCWQFSVKVENGVGTATWPSLFPGKRTVLHATIAPDGTAKVTLDGWRPKAGTPMAGAMDGRVADNHVELAGRWETGTQLTGRWTRLP